MASLPDPRSPHPEPFTLMNANNLAYIESLYQLYQQDPASVPAEWHHAFDDWGMNGHARVGTTLKPRSLFNPTPGTTPGTAPGSAPGTAPVAGDGHPDVTPPPAPSGSDASSLQHRVDMLVRNFRVRGHITAHLDPLGDGVEVPDELQPAFYGFTDPDYDRPFAFSTTVPGDRVRTLREIIEQMRHTYCGSIGVQFMHIDNLHVRQWLQNRMESTENTVKLKRKEQIRILTRLTDAVIFEEFIQRKFIGAKSFSLEGGESLIPLLDLAFERAGDQGIKEIVIGMAHRGRLNVLANILGKSPQRIFREFEDIDPQLYLGGGDVKYHLGYSGDWRTRAGKNIHLSLCFNPSHLEFVNPRHPRPGPRQARPLGPTHPRRAGHGPAHPRRRRLLGRGHRHGDARPVQPRRL